MAQTASSIFPLSWQTLTMSYHRGIKVQRSFCYVDLQSLNLIPVITLKFSDIKVFKMKVEQDFLSDFGNLDGFATRNKSNPDGEITPYI